MGWWNILLGKKPAADFVVMIIEQYMRSLGMSTLTDFVENKEFQNLLVSIGALVATKQGYTVTDQNKADLASALGSAIVAVVDAWAIAEAIKATKA